MLPEAQAPTKKYVLIVRFIFQWIIRSIRMLSQTPSTSFSNLEQVYHPLASPVCRQGPAAQGRLYL
jgi:hypothetical protein